MTTFAAREAKNEFGHLLDVYPCAWYHGMNRGLNRRRTVVESLAKAKLSTNDLTPSD